MTENTPYLLRLSAVSDIYEILIRFKDRFPRPLDMRVGDLEEYARKLSQYATVFVAKKDGAVVGFIAYYINCQETKIAYLTQITVPINSQKQGIGQYLMNCYENDAISKGFIYSKLEVDTNNISAINLTVFASFGK